MLSQLRKTAAMALPDIQCFSCGSKAKLYKVATALRGLQVPTIVVADCDVLNDQQEVRRIVKALGGSFDGALEQYKKFAAAVNAAMIPRSAAACKQRQPLPKQIKNSVSHIIEQPSQWERIKQEGRAAVLRDSPETVGHFDAVIASALASGLLINPYGELESLWPEGRKFAKSEWLVNVLEKPDLATDPELEIARRFVTELIELSIKKANFGSPV